MAAKKTTERDDRDEVDDPQFWQKHYDEGAPPWDHGKPSPPIVRLAESGALPQGKLCVLGCGWGHDAIWFATRGWSVTAVDFAEGAVAGARKRAAEAGARVRLLKMDLFHLPRTHRRRFDLVLEHTCFCAIRPERRAAYVDVVRSILRPGGTFFGVFYNHGEKGGPPFTVDAREVRRLFSPHFEIHLLETARGSFPNRAGKELLARFTLAPRSPAGRPSDRGVAPDHA